MSDFNAEVASRLRDSPVYAAFLRWAHEGGIVHPSLDFPAAFGPHGLKGIRAIHPIGSSKAILFVPYRLCLGVQAANKALQHLFDAFPAVYSEDKYKNEHRLYAFIMHEKLKGSSSFYSPYLDLLADADILCDWSETDLSELRDPEILSKVKQYQRNMRQSWSRMETSLLAFPSDFPLEAASLHALFLWTYKIVQTRSFAWGEPEGMLIPFADFLNHGDVYMGFETRTLEFLEANKASSITYIDYSDFANTHTARADAQFPHRTWTNRIGKYLRKEGAVEELKSLGSPWALEDLLKGEESSSDEDYKVQLSSDSDEDSYVSEPDAQTEDDYFVISTSAKHSLAAGQQVLISYGRHSNLGLLLYYGFALHPYLRDSVLLTIPPAETRIIPTHFRLKSRRLNEEVIAMFRKEEVNVRAKKGLVKADLRKVMGLTPILVGLEIETMAKTLAFYQKVIEERFGGTGEDTDFAILADTSANGHLIAAATYRLSQRAILSSQIVLVERLSCILTCIQAQQWSAALSSCTAQDLEALYALRSYLRAFHTNQQLWAKDFFS